MEKLPNTLGRVWSKRVPGSCLVQGRVQGARPSLSCATLSPRPGVSQAWHWGQAVQGQCCPLFLRLAGVMGKGHIQCQLKPVGN